MTISARLPYNLCPNNALEPCCAPRRFGQYNPSASLASPPGNS